MKLRHNPDHEPHLVEFSDGSYGVRRKSTFGHWEYAGKDRGHWWRHHPAYGHEYSMTREQAEQNWAYVGYRLGEGKRVTT